MSGQDLPFFYFRDELFSRDGIMSFLLDLTGHSALQEVTGALLRQIRWMGRGGTEGQLWCINTDMII